MLVTINAWQELDATMAGNVDVSNHVQLLVAATIYLHVDQPESALRVGTVLTEIYYFSANCSVLLYCHICRYCTPPIILSVLHSVCRHFSPYTGTPDLAQSTEPQHTAH